MRSLAAAVYAEPCSPAVPQLTSGLKSSWRLLAVNEVLEPDGASAVNADHMAELLRSFEMLGGQLQLQPIVVDEHLVLVDGRHRLEAAKRAGWSRIAALVICGATVEMRPLLAAEANRVRRTLNVLELESIWRAHYEPDLRAAAKERQLAGLRMRWRAVAARTPTVGICVSCMPQTRRSCSGRSKATHRRTTLA